MKLDQAIFGAFLRMMEFDELLTFLQAEIRVRGEEGFDVASIRVILNRLSTKTQVIALINKLLIAPVDKEFEFFEPGTLPEIRCSRPQDPPTAKLTLTPEALYDRIYGGWLGRVTGCVLGKPVEPWGLKEKIAQYLLLANRYPLSNYFPRLEPFPVEYQINPHANGTFLDEINGAPEDDDTDYTILALHILETYGFSFSTLDVATEWLSHLAYHRTWTAERTVYRNLILGVPATEAALLLNSEREFIGARIRTDTYGFVSPGKPELAAEMAYRDAALSHTKNGIYSAMFTAACIAWAFVANDIETIVQGGLSEIPANCRLAQAIREVLTLRSKIDDWGVAYEHLKSQLVAYHPVHAINNTVIMVLALLYGGGDFDKTICTAVMCGFDTDCNGANAGSVIGVFLGAHRIPEKWTAPLQDTLYSFVAGFRETHISEMAHRTALIAKTTLSTFR